MRPKNVYCALSAAKFSPPAARLSGLRRRLRRAEKRGFAVVLDNHDRGSSPAEDGDVEAEVTLPP